VSNRSPSGEPVRVTWDNKGRIWVEGMLKNGKPSGMAHDITVQFWRVITHCIGEYGMVDESRKAAKFVELKSCDGKTGKKRAFRITVEEISVEEDDEV